MMNFTNFTDFSNFSDFSDVSDYSDDVYGVDEFDFVDDSGSIIRKAFTSILLLAFIHVFN